MIHVLYVDDEPELLELGKIFLEQQGILVIDTAISAQQALLILERYPYDAVISDYQMPEMDGLSLLKQIRRKYDDLPFILFTGKGREEIVIEALNNGADFYLQKGGDPKAQFIELHHKILQAVKRKDSEEKILFFNRIYAILSSVNAAILRIQSKNDLLREICAIAVGQGKFSRAWIGMIDRKRESVFPVACSGYKDQCLGPVRLSITGLPSAEQASADVATRSMSIVQNDIGEGGITSEYHSTAAFPIWKNSEVIGTFQLYAFEPHFFGSDEIRMLEQVCSDISYALDRIDTEEQKMKTEQALQESEEKFRILVEESLVGVYIIKGDRFIHVNPRFAEVIGYSREEIINNLKVQDIVSPESRKMVADNLQMRLSGDLKSLHYSLKVRRKDGTDLDVEVAGTRTQYHGEPIVIGTVMNISERKQADKKILLAHRKLALLNNLTRHDIANRLTVLRGRLKLIRKRYNDPELLLQLAKVDDAGRDIYRYLETARLYQEIGMSTPRWQDVREMISREITHADQPSLNISLQLAGLEIYADPLCNRVFVNLLDNTLRHGGSVTEIRVSYHRSNGGVTIVWEDNGVGIPADLKEKIFEQGYGSNTGMGLFLCREILSGTSITLKETGTPGAGARFEIDVPGYACRIHGETLLATNRIQGTSNPQS